MEIINYLPIYLNVSPFSFCRVHGCCSINSQNNNGTSNVEYIRDAILSGKLKINIITYY